MEVRYHIHYLPPAIQTQEARRLLLDDGLRAAVDAAVSSGQKASRAEESYRYHQAKKRGRPAGGGGSEVAELAGSTSSRVIPRDMHVEDVSGTEIAVSANSVVRVEYMCGGTGETGEILWAVSFGIAHQTDKYYQNTTEHTTNKHHRNSGYRS